MLELWDFLAIAVIAWAIVEINKNYMVYKKGGKIEKSKSVEYPETLLIAGLVLAAIGLALYASAYVTVGSGLVLTMSLVPLFVGAALLIGYVFVKPKRSLFHR
ncbi:MAG: hypothetical protein J7K72_05145 [Candidatus Aenigmarchaeota archaeon]|nr:hypothetical protein [Candidatus Aenigmarchaeota archaeon]